MHALEFTGHGGVILAADGFGSPESPPVVFWPGGGQLRRSWHRVAERLAAAGHHAITVDLRGHGGSDWAPDGDYSIDAMTGDIAAVIRSLSLPPVVVGASIGGMCATIALGEHSSLEARALVVVDIVPRAEAPGVQRIRDFMAAGLYGFDSPEAAAAAVSAYLPHRSPRTAASLRPNLRHSPDGRWYWHWDPAFRNGTRATDTTFSRMSAAAPKLRLPTLLVTGGDSEVVNTGGAEDFVCSVPDARWVIVPGATHMVVGDANSAFSGAVTDFILTLPMHSQPNPSSEVLPRELQ